MDKTAECIDSYKSTPQGYVCNINRISAYYSHSIVAGGLGEQS